MNQLMENIDAAIGDVIKSANQIAAEIERIHGVPRTIWSSDRNQYMAALDIINRCASLEAMHRDMQRAVAQSETLKLRAQLAKLTIERDHAIAVCLLHAEADSNFATYVGELQESEQAWKERCGLQEITIQGIQTDRDAEVINLNEAVQVANNMVREYRDDLDEARNRLTKCEVENLRLSYEWNTCRNEKATCCKNHRPIIGELRDDLEEAGERQEAYGGLVSCPSLGVQPCTVAGVVAGPMFGVPANYAHFLPANLFDTFKSRGMSLGHGHIDVPYSMIGEVAGMLIDEGLSFTSVFKSGRNVFDVQVQREE